ncbi:hypothetical protein AC578_3376 [Pseudocercospora eumusae]|uniref:Uncharacterized protein n=1 Tax=Pseudocercospora eumusae TaxID=321146 RepID=A0A139GV25_9PEZI|nr:hypothetical protein AC578_3376 [Pseudocercospora eumusae]
MYNHRDNSKRIHEETVFRKTLHSPNSSRTFWSDVKHYVGKHNTFDIAFVFVFSKARVAAADWPAKHERYLTAIAQSRNAAVHAEDVEECTDDWNEIQMIWLNLAATFLQQDLWKWQPVIDLVAVKEYQVKPVKIKTWQHYRDSAKLIDANELQLKVQQLKEGKESGAKTRKVCEKYHGNREERQS